MALIQFTRNHSDHSTDKGYQFEFFCDRCGNGFMSEFKASATGYATGVLRAAGSMFGGIFGSASAGSYEIERVVRGPAHDKAFRDCVEETKPHFRQCPKCARWVCLSACWNNPRGLCFECAPDVQTELAVAQAHETVEQIREKVRGQDLVREIDTVSQATALCPHCGARVEGARFCPECGKPLRQKRECATCGAKAEPGAKFCPECGARLG